MKSRSEIVETLARERAVETMIENIAHQPLSADLKDLSQMVYLILLEYDEKKLQDLWEHDQMSFFLARIIVNQYRSSNSPYHALFRKFRLMVDESIQIKTEAYSKWDFAEIDIMDSVRVLRDED